MRKANGQEHEKISQMLKKKINNFVILSFNFLVFKLYISPNIPRIFFNIYYIYNMNSIQIHFY